MGSDVDDAYLVRRAQDGYVDAYADLVDRHGGLAYRVALRLLGNHHDAEDVAQEALVTAWQQLPGFRGQASFPTWLYQIVTRRALNRITRTRVTESLDLLGDVGEPGDGARPACGTRPDRGRGHGRRHGPAAPAAGRDRPAPFRGTVQCGDRSHHRQQHPGGA